MKKVLIILVALAVFTTPVVSSAALQDDLLAQIDNLLQLVLSLQQRLTALEGGGTSSVSNVHDFASCAAAGNAVLESYPRQCIHNGQTYVENITVTQPVSPSCPNITRNLGVGMSGFDVSALQRLLRDTGDFQYPEITSYYGQATEDAVRVFQCRELGVCFGNADTTGYGFVGPQTRNALLKHCGGVVPSNPGICTLEYAPVCGVKSVVASPKTYGNECQLKADGAQLLYKGECRDNPDQAPSSCKVWYDGCNTCSRTTSGGPLACTQRACIWQDTPRCEEFFEGNTGQPIIHSFSGPTVLQTNDSGTWQVRASDPENGPLLYHVDWGDTGTFSDAAAASARKAFVQTTTFTYTYSRAGVYTVTVTVRDNTGLTATTTTTVQVRANTTQTSFDVTPLQGTAPLPITATITLPDSILSVPSVCGPTVVGTIDWGDGTADRPTRLGCSSQTVVTQGHTYTQNGTYQVAFTGTDGTTSARTVVVGGGAVVCTVEYAPVCGLDNGDNETFSNRCQLDAAGATFLYSGACLPAYTGPTCTNSGQTYTEGAKLQCITTPGNTFPICIADASYVCRNGEWRIETTAHGPTCADRSDTGTYGTAYYEQCLNPTSTSPTATALNLFEPSSSSSYKMGDSIFVRWTSNVTLPDLGMYIVLEDDATGRKFKSQKVDPIAGFAVLDTGNSCNQFFSDGIDGDCNALRNHIFDGNFTFRVRAAFFTPVNACFGFCAPSSPMHTVVSESTSSSFTLGI